MLLVFLFRWGYLSRAGLWDKSHLTKQVEKYVMVVLPLVKSSNIMGCGIACSSEFNFLLLLSLLFAGMLIYIHQGFQISYIIRHSCISVHKNRFIHLLCLLSFIYAQSEFCFFEHDLANHIYIFVLIYSNIKILTILLCLQIFLVFRGIT